MEHPQSARYRPRPTWHRSNLRQFLAAQAEHIVAVDFLHVDTINLKRIYALVMLEHGSRRAHLLGVTANPTGPWTTQAARNFLMVTGMNIAGIEFLIRDHGGQFTDAFDAACADVGLRVLKSPPQAPKANAHCERFIGTLRRELLDRALILDERHLRRTLTRYLEHYNGPRPHRALSQLSVHRKLKPDRRAPSTSPSTASTAQQSSADSSMNTRSPADTTTNPQISSRIPYLSPTAQLTTQVGLVNSPASTLSSTSTHPSIWSIVFSMLTTSRTPASRHPEEPWQSRTPNCSRT
ncbi:integrase core domain-containing protein [Streptomyces sp. NPDC056634]|uniref:integrase core domain-containing protein n=1 Tax=Streptomyces sp. NPDC056634 TaxID=3345885 RepID=UPI0036C8E8F3